MSETIDAAVNALSDRLAGQSFDGSVRFVIADEGSVRIDESGVSKDESDADCTITADAETFELTPVREEHRAFVLEAVREHERRTGSDRASALLADEATANLPLAN